MIMSWIAIVSALAAFLIGYGLRHFAGDWDHRARTARSLQAEQLKATVTASLDGVIIIDAKGRVLQFSESAERIYGYKSSDIIGKEMARFIVPERYREAHRAGMSRMRDTGKAKLLGQRIEIESIRANGEEFMAELAISRSRGSSGDIFIAYVRDITEAKEAERALLDAKEAAELANNAKTKFISFMSHEIRTPFNAVLGIFDILGDTKLSKDQQYLVQTAEHASRALLRIINDVLDYARISSGSTTIVAEPFHAPDVFNDVYRLYAMYAKERNIDLSMTLTKAKDVYLLGDVGRISQILMNLVSNAIKHTKDGAVELIVETKDGEEGKVNLLCMVIDNGLGISEAKQAFLFDEFYMAEDINTRESEGTGLGLTICKSLTKMMGGTIGVDSELGAGSTFWINLPLQKTKSAIAAVEEPIIKADISGVRILLAEDNPTNRMVVSRILEKEGAVITTAANGVEAMDFMHSCAFDLLLTDVFMPEMSGTELVEQLRAGDSLNANLPVIALTAMGDIHEAEALKAHGVDQVMLKPFNSKDLIRGIAEQHTAMRENFVRTSSGKSAPKDDVEMSDIKMSGGLTEGLDAEDLAAIKEQFEIDLRATSKTLAKAIEQEDVEGAKFASHTLKGLAGLYGLSSLHEAAMLTNSHCSKGTIKQMVQHGMRAVKIASVIVLKIDDLFLESEEAA